MAEFLVVFFLMGGGWLLLYIIKAFMDGNPQREYEARIATGVERYKNCSDVAEALNKVLDVYKLTLAHADTKTETIRLYIYFDNFNLVYEKGRYDSDYKCGTVLVDYEKKNIRIGDRDAFLKVLADKLEHELGYNVSVSFRNYHLGENVICLSQKNPSYIPPRTI